LGSEGKFLGAGPKTGKNWVMDGRQKRGQGEGGKPKNWIHTPEQLVEMCKQLEKADVIGLDTEFVRETTFYPQIALIQLASKDGCWLVDPLAFENHELEPFFEILKSPKILKVIHAAFADQECFYSSYGFTAEPVLDTAVAAALLGYGDNIGLQKLLRNVIGVNLRKGRSRVKWLDRPLSEELLHYAEQDVLYLLQLTDELKRRLDKKGRWEWSIAESRVDPKVFEVTADDMAVKIARGGQIDAHTFHALVLLLRWREERARQANLPRGWVAGNEVLVSLARSKPKSVQELRTFRGISAKEIDRQGERILGAITNSKNAEGLPPLPETYDDGGEDVEDHAMDLLKAYVAFLSAKFQIASRFLLNSSKARELLLKSDQTLDAWVNAGLVTTKSADLVGPELKAFLSGKKGLCLAQGKVTAVDTAPTN